MEPRNGSRRSPARRWAGSGDQRRSELSESRRVGNPLSGTKLPAFERAFAMSRLSEKYKKEIAPALGKKLGRENVNSLPRLEKISVNMGVGKALQDKNRMEHAVDDLGKITGQKPQVTKSRVAVSGFRLREGNEIGCR